MMTLAHRQPLLVVVIIRDDTTMISRLVQTLLLIATFVYDNRYVLLEAATITLAVVEAVGIASQTIGEMWRYRPYVPYAPG